MNDSNLNSTIKSYVRDHLSPTKKEIEYVDHKFKQVDDFLEGRCFRSGSFARHTAIRPIHDLDIIWLNNDESMLDDPEAFLQQLAIDLKEQYEEFSSVQPDVSVQTHSITLTFTDNDIEDGFSVDIVPAIQCTDPEIKNEFGDFILKVPEVLKYSHSNRPKFYAEHTNPSDVTWIYSDPNGYISQAIAVDASSNGNYRKTTKLIKAWRHGAKSKNKDGFRLKAFHVEQICIAQFLQQPDMTVYDAVRRCFTVLSDYIIGAPCIEDIAYAAMGEDRYIDEGLTPEQKTVILASVSSANGIIAQLASCSNESEVNGTIEQLIGLAPATARSAAPVTYAGPSSPWYRGL